MLEGVRGKPKFINLDMEEYKDLGLTIDVFTSTLEQEKFVSYYGGIVLQAYLPDSHLWQQKLVLWSKKRMLQGGSPIKIRLVKGANLQMELVDSSLHNWPCPVLPAKVLVDANFKKMLEFAMEPSNIQAVHLGIGSHNLFDIAYAALMAKEKGVEDYFSFELLEGMADGVRKELAAEEKQLVMYAPLVEENTFLQSIGYLIRRLDENSGKENFLRFSLFLQYGSSDWKFLEQQFLEAHRLKASLSPAPIRSQNRQLVEKAPDYARGEFSNEPDTDFHLEENLKFAWQIKKTYQKTADHKASEVPVLVGAESKTTSQFWDFFDPNTTDRVHLYRLYLSSETEILQALEWVEKDASGWRKSSLEERYGVLRKVAQNLRQQRGHLIGLMAQVTGKVFVESDVEISEAIDFAEYYPASLYRILEETGAKARPKGVVLVISPWNFPTAIPAGGVLAALATGNSVILKPAPEAAVIGVELAKIFWDAGVPKDALQVINCQENQDLVTLSTHPYIQHIIFTGGTLTAQKILENAPKIALSAETGGKNATIVTELADHDLAIKNVIHSAFSNGGQKCSATSLLILPRALYQDPKFKERLLDCAQSYKVGSAWDLENFTGPLIKKPEADLKTAIDHLQEKESWWLQSGTLADNPRLVTPAIKWGVKAGSFCHQKELFGPVLAVIEAQNFEEAISIANDTEFGLTAGLESLNEKEQELWLEKMEAGNLYINRGTTGAIVERQPFGGMKKSAFGPGMKAGGPNYCLQLADFQESAPKEPDHQGFIPPYSYLADFAELFQKVSSSFTNYPWRMAALFEKKQEFAAVIGQRNFLRYKKGQSFGLRIEKTDDFADILRASLALTVARTVAHVSLAAPLNHPQKELLEKFWRLHQISFRVETEDAWLASLHSFQRLRILSQPSLAFYQAAAKAYKPWISHKPYQDGRLELPFYLQEQSISFTYHRYGNLSNQPAWALHDGF